MSLLFHRLYVRIWLAVVLAVAVLTLLVGYAWRMTAEPPLREVVVRNAIGDVIGSGQARLGRGPEGKGWRPNRAPADTGGPGGPGESNAEEDQEALRGKYGYGPEFLVRMNDGQTMHLHLPRPPAATWRAPFGFVWTLGLVAVAVALAIYPIVRRLTRRLETLQRSVERWGDGDLSVRMPIGGQDEVGFLATRFNKAAEQIETLVKTREALLTSQKSLLANASHELRSPLTRIRMGLELMGNNTSLTARQEISRNIGELDQLIDEILLASRLDAREADLGTVELVDLVGLSAEECARTQATLDVETPSVVVPGVAKLLRRAVRNLLENARRYASGEVTLAIRSADGFATIAVSDHGPGVPEALQERIFEPFYRLPGASEREGGVGLGLALVKSIAQRHGGSVQCRNRPEGGACFEVSLPLHS
ncbi:two-component sensor histidine kinase [Rhodoferax lacus]|uniref:histidine kinase n=1 Tax=Rhodoferax lacus TaxID=2184758 RepID=A0A3E1R803_9BURK|nr:ATP-binding protein [Rhodoferax lacus]RFO95172.1 two-component sensor histidine kinase [Rhodoferax lacus]